MTSEQFVYWLQGYAELGSLPPNGQQWQSIKDHLNLVFKKETPDRAENFPWKKLPVNVMPFLSEEIHPNDPNNILVC